MTSKESQCHTESFEIDEAKVYERKAVSDAISTEVNARALKRVNMGAVADTGEKRVF